MTVILLQTLLSGSGRGLRGGGACSPAHTAAPKILSRWPESQRGWSLFSHHTPRPRPSRPARGPRGRRLSHKLLASQREGRKRTTQQTGDTTPALLPVCEQRDPGLARGFIWACSPTTSRSSLSAFADLTGRGLTPIRPERHQPPSGRESARTRFAKENRALLVSTRPR
jgi:hypothetical protein